MRVSAPPRAGLALLLGLTAAGALPAQDQDDDRSQERERMVRTQIERRGVKDPETVRAMRAVPRHLFVPPSLQGRAYGDHPLPIGHGQTISQPYIVAYMTETLELRPNMKVLEIGTGSGYQAAVLAELSEHVYTIEIIPELAGRAQRALAADATRANRVQARTGDGYHGWPEAGPFDVIIVTAAAESIPPPLLGQLAEGGRMVIPVGPRFGAQNLVLVTKREGRARTRLLMSVKFVPLVRADERD